MTTGRQAPDDGPEPQPDVLVVGADLTGANLTGGVDLGGVRRDADLTSADLTSVRWPEGVPIPDGWTADSDSGRLQRAGQLSEVIIHYL